MLYYIRGMCFLFAWGVTMILCQPIPSSFPHNYDEIPNVDANFSDSHAWQECEPTMNDLNLIDVLNLLQIFA
jgi:hypothetical protein